MVISMKTRQTFRSLCLALVAGVAVLLGGDAHAQQFPPLPIDTAVRVGQLENGLTYFIRKNALPEGRAHFYISQRVGSMQEEENQRGLAHFLEHIAFNGTKHFPGKNMISWLETIGVRFGTNLNAYTGFDETVYTIMDAPVERTTVVDSCILILRDWSCGIALEDKEIDAERGVIQEEWRQRNSGNQRVLEQVFQQAFPGNRYGERMPIGLMEVVRGFKYQELRDYYKKWYRPDLQAVIIVGDIDPDAVEAKIKQTFADVPKPVNAAARTYQDVADHEGVLAFVATDPEATGTRISINFKQDAAPAEMRASQIGVMVDFVNEVVAAMANQRFDEMTKKPNAPFLYGALMTGDYMMVARTKDAYNFTVVAADGQYKAALSALVQEVERIRQFGFTEGEYKRAVADIMVSMKKSYNERDKRKNGTFADQYSQYFLRGGYIPTMETLYTLYQQLAQHIPVAMINQTLLQGLGEDNIVVYLTGPAKESIAYPTNEELRAEFVAARSEKVEPYKDAVSSEKLMEKLPKAGKVVKEDKNGKFGTTIWTLSNGIRVVYKVTDFKEDEIHLSGIRPGGYLLYGERDRLTTRVLSSVIGLGGLADFDDSALTKVLAGRMASLSTNIGETEEVVSGTTTREDLETMMQLLYLNFTSKRSDAEAFAAYQEQAVSLIKMKRNNPMGSLPDSLGVALYANNPYVQSLSEEEVARIDYARAMQIYKERFGDASGFQFYLVGNIEPTQLRPLVERYIASLPVNKKARHVAPYDKLYRTRRGEYTNHYTVKMEAPKGFVFDAFTGVMPVNARTRLSFEILSEVLQQVYIETLREDEGGTYGASVNAEISYQPKGEAVLQIAFQTDPSKAKHLNAIVHQEIERIARDGVPTDKFDKVVANLEKEYSESVKENNYWLGTLRAFFYHGRDRHTNYLSTLRAITPAEVQAQLKELLAQGNRIELMMLPEFIEAHFVQ